MSLSLYQVCYISVRIRITMLRQVPNKSNLEVNELHPISKKHTKTLKLMFESKPCRMQCRL